MHIISIITVENRLLFQQNSQYFPQELIFTKKSFSRTFLSKLKFFGGDFCLIEAYGSLCSDNGGSDRQSSTVYWLIPCEVIRRFITPSLM